MDSGRTRRVERRRTYTLREVVARDLKARHDGGSGLTYERDGDHCLVTDAEHLITMLETDNGRLTQRGRNENENAT